MLVPFEWLYFFYDENLKDVEPNDYIYVSQLERYAAKNDNSVAYSYYKEIIDNQITINHYGLKVHSLGCD